jgi:hypothetical protein
MFICNYKRDLLFGGNREIKKQPVADERFPSSSRVSIRVVTNSSFSDIDIFFIIVILLLNSFKFICFLDAIQI